jgi:hypothetical protein
MDHRTSAARDLWAHPARSGWHGGCAGVYEEDDIWAAVPVSEREDGGYELWLPGDVPRFYKFLPLVAEAGA